MKAKKGFNPAAIETHYHATQFRLRRLRALTGHQPTKRWWQPSGLWKAWGIGIVYAIRNKLMRDCGHVCGWTYPHGFVPEANCPVHDKA